MIAFGRGNGLRAQLVRGGMGVGLLKVLSLPLSLLSTILLARGLGPEGFGQYAFVIALITVLAIPIGPALMQLATRETAGMHQGGEEDRLRVFLGWANCHVWFGSALIVVAVGGVAVWMADWQLDDRWTLLLLGLAALPLIGLNAVRAGILTGLRRVVLGQFPDLSVRPFVLLLVAGLLLEVGSLNPLTAVAAFVAGTACAFVVGAVFLRRTFPQEGGTPGPIDAEQRRQWMRAWMPFTLLVAASTLNGQIGILLLGWLSSADQVAAMQVAERGAMLVALSLTVVNLVIGPHITQIHRSGDKARLQTLSRHSARMALLVALPIALPLIFFGGPILSMVFGAEYVEIGTLPLAILAIGQLINVAFGSVGRLLVMSGYEIQSLYGQVVALLVVVVSGLILCPLFGATGAALAIAAGILVWNGVLAFKVVQILGIRVGVV
ncbi:MAG: oligosaccharide flippase family protein [Halothiobacillus sp.]|jgi:O-antigen/teichoic acid export membrane protein|nr:oligosaccharide flippase family protein [Halothiobacillus sp.]